MPQIADFSAKRAGVVFIEQMDVVWPHFTRHHVHRVVIAIMPSRGIADVTAFIYKVDVEANLVGAHDVPGHINRTDPLRTNGPDETVGIASPDITFSPDNCLKGTQCLKGPAVFDNDESSPFDSKQVNEVHIGWRS